MREEISELKKTKNMRKMTKVRIKNIGLYYLKRFESSVANLRGVLRRRINEYGYYNPDFNRQEAYDWVEEVLDGFKQIGYLDDKRYGELKLKSYMVAGKSPRYIQGKLREKGIDEKIIDNLMAEQEFNPFESAMKLARKKRIGPYCLDEKLRQERRAKDLAILVRAGFDYDVAISVIDGSAD